MHKDSYTDVHLSLILETYLELPMNQEYFLVKAYKVLSSYFTNLIN